MVTLQEQRGFTLNAIKGDMVHYCVTGRLANDEQALAKFEEACAESVAALAKLAERVKAGEIQFPGSAGMSVSLFLSPSQTSWVVVAVVWIDL